MIFPSAFRKELSSSFLASFFVLTTVVMTNMLIQILGQAQGGRVNPAEIMQVMGYTVLGYSTTVLTLSLFICVVLTLSRMYSDSEMQIWFSSGQSLFAFISPIFKFAWPVLLLIVVSAVTVWPWSNGQVQALKDRFQSRNDIERIAPGKFQTSAGGKSTFFIDKEGAEGQLGVNVFIETEEYPLTTTTVAKQGQIFQRDGERFLKLMHGQQFVHNQETGERRITQFVGYEKLIDDQVVQKKLAPPAHMLPTLELLKNPSPYRNGELSWRLGQALSAVNFLLLALALSAVNPRAGKTQHLGLAILVFILYYNMINVGQSWISRGLIAWPTWLLTLHGSVLLLSLAWLFVRQSNKRWF